MKLGDIHARREHVDLRCLRMNSDVRDRRRASDLHLWTLALLLPVRIDVRIEYRRQPLRGHTIMSGLLDQREKLAAVGNRYISAGRGMRLPTMPLKDCPADLSAPDATT